MSLRNVLGDVAIKSVAARPAGTYSSGPIANPGATSNVVAMVHASAVSGSTQTLDVAIQTSPDNSTWSTVTGGSIAQMSAVGNSMCNAYITDEYVQILATVGGTGTPTVTFRVEVMVIPS
jgi:hypothetical protein